MDSIRIEDLRVDTIIGTFPEERLTEQPVIFDLELRGDFSAAQKSDDLKDAVDYFTLEQRVVELARQGKFQLLEALTGAVADLVMSCDGVQECRVTAYKPRASAFGAKISVTAERARK